MPLVAEEVRDPQMAISGMGSLNSGSDRGKLSSSSGFPLLFLPETITVRTMGEAGNQDGNGVGTGFPWDESGYLSLSEELVLG